MLPLLRQKLSVAAVGIEERFPEPIKGYLPPLPRTPNLVLSTHNP
jgi:hypothetical protein